MNAPLAIVSWRGNEPDIPVESTDRLDRVLDSIAGSADPHNPIGVEVSRRNGDSLLIALGREESVLSFVGASLDPPYFSSVGNEGADGHFVYSLRGEYSEVPRSHVIETQLARETVRKFVSEDGLPTVVRWDVD